MDRKDPDAIAKLAETALKLEVFDQAELLFREARELYLAKGDAEKAKLCELSQEDASAKHRIRQLLERLRQAKQAAERGRILEQIGAIDHPQADAVLLVERARGEGADH